ncbi:MAG: alanine--tRNA ligase [Synergistaceae bacterium]|nr:alanine--tRNA ligase [Synergistota bacterium]NLM71198.1 alanine--tRNA ligase [Synergistaceae bacterium]
MQWRSGRDIRSLFIDFWVSKGSRHVPSFSLIPDDPSLLFTIAGMVPFKPYFLGIRKPETPRAVTSQKCVRTNDIENVGRTARHHTFFEMLGNFAWGDYFKREAITWAWEFLTEHIGLEPDRMYATIYLEDEEAFDVWHREVGLPEDRISRFDKDENFWFMGSQGPCGPCSEIMYDQGPEYSCGRPECAVGCDCDRYLEIWNLVFTQFDLQKDGTLVPLPKKNIDTGMGLERLASVVQRVRTDFETDLFRPLLDRACSLGGITYGDDQGHDLAARVIADHVRSVIFMIADGILPSNDGRGYVLRRLLRRAARFGRLLGVDRPFLLDFVPDVIELMGDPYREIIDNRLMVEQIISVEEKRFGHTLQQGTELLESEMSRLRSSGEKVLSGAVAFELYDTYGFPPELTDEMVQENGFTMNREEFDREMQAQRERARASSKQKMSEMTGDVYTELNETLGDTEFIGYSDCSAMSTVEALISAGGRVESVDAGEEAEVVLDRTPFYAERGGQVGDTGMLGGEGLKVEVLNTVMRDKGLTVHSVKVVEGRLRVGDTVHACVDAERLRAIRRNHTATHLLHESLARVLGGHVRQSGSLVGEKVLRFDFTHFEPMTRDQIDLVERKVNARILSNEALEVIETDMEHAREEGAKALFEEKYDDVVRVVRISDFSSELCGGLHVDSTGEIGLFKILKEESIGSGTRRIVAVTGMEALAAFQRSWRTLAALAGLLSSDEANVHEKVENLMGEVKSLSRAIEEMKISNLGSRLESSLRRASARGVKVMFARFDGVDAEALREMGDRLLNKRPGKAEAGDEPQGEGKVVVLASVADGNAIIVAMADKKALDRGISAGKIVKEGSAILGGGGGGRPAMAQGGGKNLAALEDFFKALPGMVESQAGGKAGE